MVRTYVRIIYSIFANAQDKIQTLPITSMTTRWPQSTAIITLLICTLLVGTNGIVSASDTPSYTWSSDVVGVNEMQLSSNYWVERTKKPTQLLKNGQTIIELNTEAFSSDENLVNLALFPQHLSSTEVKNKILAVSKPSKSDRYDQEGRLLDAAGYQKLADNLNLENIAHKVEIRFALVVKRSDMRSYPTTDRFYSTTDSKNLDRFQENGLFPGDALAVLHQSTDGEWFFVQSYNYPAWVHKQDLAFGERDVIEQYRNADQFLVITGDKVSTSFNPELAAVSELQLDMGIRVPLLSPNDLPEDIANNLSGQNPYASYIVLLPVRDETGGLEIKPALIARNKDVHKGYLPYTRENITRQAFKFLGERYGWGHSYNARDCTGFVSEVYKTFGIYMPRNSGQQGQSEMGDNTRFAKDSSREDKLETFKSLDTGDLIYIPGHVMMYIGDVDDQPYVIHDVSGLSYIKESGEYYKGVLNGVSVTPLIPLHLSQETTYVDKMYNIKKVR